jgi:putative hydrolase of HD superfamily
MTNDEDPIGPVAAQLDAYNARDIEAFVRHWAQDCEVHAFPHTLIARGLDALRMRHVERFKEPNLFGRLHARVAVGNVVVDHETVTRTFPEGPGEVEVIGIDQVEAGLIAKA